MNVDGDFEFYRFIWSGADQGWGIYSFPPEHGIEITFSKEKPNAKELKIIREFWPRLKSKPIDKAIEIIGNSSFVFGQWPNTEASTVCKEISNEGIKAKVVNVPNYSIVNMKTREVAQIRSGEIYDQVVDALINNGGEIIQHSGIYPSGGIIIDEVE